MPWLPLPCENLSIHCTILWNVLCLPRFFNMRMNLRLPSCQFQMFNTACLISFYFKWEPTSWTPYFTMNLRKQKRNISLPIVSEESVEKNTLCCAQISLWWSVNYDNSNRKVKSLSEFFLCWARKYSTQYSLNLCA